MATLAPEGTDARRQAIGLTLVVYAACALGLAAALSRFAYDGGSNGITVATVRALLMLAGFAVFFLLSGRSLRLSWRRWRHCAFNGFLMVFMFYGNIGAVEFIPIGLAALLFFTYPPIIAVMVAVTVREPVPLAKAICVGTAFLGLAVMLGVSIGSIDPRGAALALSASLACATNAVWIGRYGRDFDLLVATFHMALVAAVLMVLLCVLSGGAVLPVTSLGWFGMLTVAFLQASTVPIYFRAISLIGALKGGMVGNVQPLVSIGAAYLLFGEVLSTFQFVGGAMVLASIWAMHLHDSRTARMRGLS